MRMTRGWTGLRTAVIALGLIAWNAPHADADGISQDNISAIQHLGCRRDQRDHRRGQRHQLRARAEPEMVDTASNISLGYFQVAPLAAGQSTTYHDTTFTMTFGPSTVQCGGPSTMRRSR